MILCVTPNTALDRTLVVPGYGAGGVFRPQQTIATVGGKGVNVARVVNLLGGAAHCMGFIAGHTGALAAAIAVEEGLDSTWTALDAGETRICTILVDSDSGQTTVVNESGAQTRAADWSRLRDDVLAAAAQTEIICFCGSLPPASPLDSFTALLGELVAAGKSVWVDTSGAPLAAAVQVSGVHIKVNDEEAGVLLGRSLNTLSDVTTAAIALAKGAPASVIITMGKDGAALSDGQTVWHALPPEIDAKSGVGSGDSMLAGLLVGLESGETPAQALRRGVAAGAANALTVGAGRFALSDFTDILSHTTLA